MNWWKMHLNLYDTFGFPIDLTKLIATENNLTVDEEVLKKKCNNKKIVPVLQQQLIQKTG